ncbi:unnamed protein product [Eruca vesicaria subsp. sativa]|uniref:Uncharacterized protein n=1 Tax=Eruca vesicaria subsp. sativa TaxID=29727 RepID=A0ABC8JB38_ERUVS|nr:unnamed protein product [Eruca vesicaria subsp. sativa]
MVGMIRLMKPRIMVSRDRVISDLILDLEAITPRLAEVSSTEISSRQEKSEERRIIVAEKSQEIRLIEPTTEAFHAIESDNWENRTGGVEVRRQEEKPREIKGIQKSPSRYSPLQDIMEEEDEDCEEKVQEVEEGASKTCPR